MELSNAVRREVYLLLKKQVTGSVPTPNYLPHLEHAIFEFSEGQGQQYQQKFIQIMYLLTHQPQMIWEHPPQRLVYLQTPQAASTQTNDELMFQNLVKTSHQHMEDASRTLEHSLSLQAVSANPVTAICRKCRSTDVTYDQKMTRSADEAMTSIFSCHSCGARWKG